MLKQIYIVLYFQIGPYPSENGANKIINKALKLKTVQQKLHNQKQFDLKFYPQINSWRYRLVQTMPRIQNN
jgi:hypothetical protein